MFKIETKRLIIRDMQAKDADDFVNISQHSDYQRYYSEEDNQADHYRNLTKLFIEQAGETPRHAYQMAIEDKATGDFIGIVCLRLEADKQASVGCGLAVNRQGEGIMLEASTAMIDYGFKALAVHRIYAETIASNKSAIKLCQSLGMRQEAHFKQNRYFKQQWWDTVVFAILANEWQVMSQT